MTAAPGRGVSGAACMNCQQSVGTCTCDAAPSHLFPEGCTCDPEAYETGPEGQRRYFEDRYCPTHGEVAQARRLIVRVHEILMHGERDDTYNSGVIGGALQEIERGGWA